MNLSHIFIINKFEKYDSTNGERVKENYYKRAYHHGELPVSVFLIIR